MAATRTLQKRRGSPGFSLLELMVALFILAVGMLAVASMQSQAIRGNSFSDLVTIGNTLAQAKMEFLMGLAPTDANLKDNNTANNANLQAAINTGATAAASDYDGYVETKVDRYGNVGSGIFTRIWNVAKRDPANPSQLGYPAEGLMTVVVIVRWTDQRGSHQAYVSSIKPCPAGCPSP
ncbi:MAG TPA: prepilin-type N-terminal cleavage/methylation domain-containing protein [Syntrophobacteria bacterium]|nr:prepilin-type N-terminal cleavage/methylation domain-containing protein [Syntrophobacteria bacterium]